MMCGHEGGDLLPEDIEDGPRHYQGIEVAFIVKRSGDRTERKKKEQLNTSHPRYVGCCLIRIANELIVALIHTERVRVAESRER